MEVSYPFGGFRWRRWSLVSPTKSFHDWLPRERLYMPAAVSTITQTGQVSIPKVIRDILGVGPRDQVEFLSDGERVQIVAVPKDPLTLGTKEEFWESIARADEDVSSGRTSDLLQTTSSLRAKYGL